MHIRKLLALALCACLILSLIPAVAADNETLTPALNGNKGATITCSSTPLSAEVDDNDLAIVEIRGSKVNVIGKENAVGVARLTVQTASGYHVFDIPIGYTTFVFDGNTLTVIEGDSANYEVAGVNPANEEYLVGDPSFPLPVSLDANGNQVFVNTDTYKLCVGLKKNGGTYVFTGTGTDGCIAVKKAAVAPTTVLLAGLNLTSSFTAPLAVKKESTTTATITALGGFVNTLTDNPFNNADNYGDPTEDGGDGTNVEYAESAVIKCKSNSQVTLNGAGTLNLNCSTKNGLKSGEYGSLTIDELTLNVNSVKNGISADNLLTVNGGKISVTTTANTGDCIRSDPDAVDAAAGCAANIVINGGEFTLQADGDGIQSAQDLTINGGSFNIRAGSGYNDSSFNKDTMSRKGLKGGNPSDDETVEGTNVVTINGGEFTINTPDDAIHSDGTVVITGGDFTIQTGDDGVHGEIQADFGVQNAPDCKIHMTVSTSYEGLEAKDVYIRSGCYDVTASDDGINAAGGSSNGSDPSPWGPGGPGGGGTAGDYTLAISGGNVNVNCNGDGLDSNGALNITGGQSIVWAQAPNGDNSPLDCDGTMTVNGGMVFGGGTNPMNENPSTSTSQPYVLYGGSSGGWGGGSSSTISSGRTVVVKNASSQTVFSIKAPKNINYAIYSSPSMSSSSGWSITSDTSTPTVTRYWAEHSYGSYVQTQAPTCTVPGIRTATCSLCGDTQTQEIAPTGHSWSYVTIAPTATLEGYDLYTCATCGGQYRTNFVDPLNGPNPCQNGHTWDAGVVTVQPTCTEAGETTYTCTVCGETNVLASPAALGHDFNETTGVCERCGAEAFRITYVCVGGVSVTAFPSQDLTTGGVANATTVFVRNSGGGIDISGSGQANFLAVLEEGYGVASVEVTPAGSYNAIKYPIDIGVEHAYRVTKINQDVTITITAEEGLCEHEFDEDGFCIHCGIEAPKAVFVTDGHAVVTAYPTQDLTTGGVVNATVALARNSDTGEVDLNGNGQVNFTVAPNPGYDVESITATPTSAYNKYKDNGDGSYRLTKVNATVTVTITTVPNGEPMGSTVSLIASGTAQGSLVAQDGETVTLPTTVTVNPADWTFIGWVEQQIDETTTAPSYYAPGASYTVNGDATLYALYTRTEGGGAIVYQLADSLENGGKYILVAESSVSGTAGSAVGNTAVTSNHYLTPVSVTINSDDTCTASNVNAVLWEAAASGSGYTLYNAAAARYIGLDSTEYLAPTSSGVAWVYTSEGYLDNQIDSEGYYYLSYSGSGTIRYTTSKSGAVIRLYRQANSSTTWYWTDPVTPALVDVYFVDQDGNANAYVYAFGSGVENAPFPGEVMTALGVDENGDNYYKVTLDRSVYTNVIFSGGDNTTQTADLGLGTGEYVVYYVNDRTGYVGEDIWPAPAEVVEPTCTEVGSTTYTGMFTGKEHSSEIAALGHLPGEPVQENYVEPTATVDGGYDTVVYCQRCNAELSREHTVLPATGPVEPIETTALHIYSSISVGTDMIMGFTARKADLTNYADFWIEIVKHDPDGDVSYTYGKDVLFEGSSTWGIQFKKIYAKEMGIDVEARVYAKDADGQVFMSPALTTNIRDYLGGRLTATNNKVEQRVLAADMLNYGAAAQMFMDFQTDHLVNEELTEAQLAKLHEYETTGLPVAEKTNYNTRPEGQDNILFTSVTIGNEVLLGLTIRLNESAGNVQVLVREHKDDGTTGDIVTTLDATFTTSTFLAAFNGIGADKMRTEYDFVTLVNGVETGNIRTWSLEGYVGEIRAEGIPLKVALGNALLNYGDSAAAYFAAQ